MKERPILFKNEMVEAILRELPKIPKTQTRRGMKQQGVRCDNTGVYLMTWDEGEGHHWRQDVPCPYGQPGDRLWVKETHWRWGKWIKNGVNAKGKPRWKFRANTHDFGVQFKAPAPPPKRGKLGWHKRPSLFMPRLAARAVLEIVKVRAERLQDISEADAMAEGVQPIRLGFLDGRDGGNNSRLSYIEAYGELWESINGVGSWDRNDYVWVIEFKRL